MACVVHIVSCLIFWRLEIPMLAGWDFASALLWFVLWVLFVNRRLFASVVIILMLIEVPIRAALFSWHIGITSSFWLLTLGTVLIIPLIPFFSLRLKIITSVFYAVVFVVTASLPVLYGTVSALSSGWQMFFLISNTGTIALFLIVVLLIFGVAVSNAETGLQREHDRADGLLKNILPDPIALRLKDGEHLIADDHPEVSVLFADIVDFTEASARLTPTQLVETLNLVFTEFDHLATKHGAEKIKTIGDAYMAVIGVPEDNKHHAQVAVELGLDMLASARRISAKTHFPIELRIGINAGPVVAGVIGESKFAYDLWGDAVNVASRMEAHSEPGKILITQSIKALLPDRFDVQPLGQRNVKGKGQMPVFTVTPSAV